MGLPDYECEVNDMSVNLETWTPKLIIADTADLGGQPITSTYWNSLWKLHREQGDDTADALKTLLDTLKATVLHPTNAAGHISNPAVYPNGATLISGQLNEILADIDGVKNRTTSTEEVIENILNGYLTVAKSDTLQGHQSDYFATAASVSALSTRLDNVSIGAISAFKHNGIGSRDAANAHPISAITGLEAALAAVPVNHSSLLLRDAANSHPATAIRYSDSLTLAQKLDAIDTVIASITGGISEIEHNTLLFRNAEDAHPISAITGLEDALTGKQAEITGAVSDLVFTNAATNKVVVSNSTGKLTTHAVTNTELGYLQNVTSNIQTQLNAKQTKVTASTSAPSGGADGDVWIQYA